MLKFLILGGAAYVAWRMLNGQPVLGGLSLAGTGISPGVQMGTGGYASVDGGWISAPTAPPFVGATVAAAGNAYEAVLRSRETRGPSPGPYGTADVLRTVNDAVKPDFVFTGSYTKPAPAIAGAGGLWGRK